MIQYPDTLTTGSNGPMWVYSDYDSVPYNARLAQLVQPDIIKIDPGEPGSIETSFVQNRIPAITLELGPPSVWEKSYINRATDFIFRLLTDLHMTPTLTTPTTPTTSTTTITTTTKEVVVGQDLTTTSTNGGTYVSTNRIDIPATRAGWQEAHVDVLEDVRQGQEVVTVYNSWGDIVEKVKAPAAGRVLQVRTDPAVEGGTIVLVLVNNGTATTTTTTWKMRKDEKRTPCDFVHIIPMSM